MNRISHAFEWGELLPTLADDTAKTDPAAVIKPNGLETVRSL
jgi:hypothetical protein